MELVVSKENLKRLVSMKVEEIKNTFFDEIEEIKSTEIIDENGETIFFIYVYDDTNSMTSIKCDKRGWEAQWGNYTPVYVKMTIEWIMCH
ncbi:hypothetical protein [Bacillus thuringiensis]|uniref:Uncharacterized protein n=1 Tax=Bacillus thuringiensis subsp. darmstadiensis TaxID=132264 RepID=A0A9X6G608_BACUD|nr:hypothetical protein BMB171_C1494 [Bacillus thuringiensis BMB171]OTZ29059.1 hypothetical protein BK761_29345 [Bacillus thuringiensis serovar darmstadiensis]ADH09518.1 hypothetical protein BMB171_C4710 [Bacillus thuringiensis BMB171]OTZ33813.1 hypothetical protein BK761_12545 [Bacillus thuringiensis serovar darmstadiensis]OTZ34117.1 hypothetical protein BK761_11350 [Bacillus thuringiensis serovar darmstadiensis]